MNTFLVFTGYESWRMQKAHSSLSIPRMAFVGFRSSTRSMPKSACCVDLDLQYVMTICQLEMV